MNDQQNLDREMALPTATQLLFRLRWIPWILLALSIGLQILWPLAEGQSRITLTIVTVLVVAGTNVAHAWIYRGLPWAAGYLAITFAFALTLEAVGTNTGFPFGAYTYGDMLGPRVADVPLLIPAAWAMTAYPVLLLSRRLASHVTTSSRLNYAVVVAIGAFAMTSWDLFLDPQMVSQGYWVWDNPTPSLPGIDGIPAGNYVGWLGGSAVLMFFLNLLPRRTAPEGVPAALWTWTWVGGIVANAFFLGRPSVALVGGIVMGLVTVPYLIVLRADTNAASTRRETST